MMNWQKFFVHAEAFIAGLVIAMALTMFAFTLGGYWLAVPMVFIAGDVGLMVYFGLVMTITFKMKMQEIAYNMRF